MPKAKGKKSSVPKEQPSEEPPWTTLKETPLGEYSIDDLQLPQAVIMPKAKGKKSSVPKEQPSEDKPGPPGISSFSEITDNSVKVTWSRPEDDGGSPITNYRLEYVEVDGKKGVHGSVVKHSGTTRVVKPLKKDQEYLFCVCAENKVGTGPFSHKEQIKIAAPLGERQLRKRGHKSQEPDTVPAKRSSPPYASTSGGDGDDWKIIERKRKTKKTTKLQSTEGALDAGMKLRSSDRDGCVAKTFKRKHLVLSKIIENMSDQDKEGYAKKVVTGIIPKYEPPTFTLIECVEEDCFTDEMTKEIKKLKKPLLPYGNFKTFERFPVIHFKRKTKTKDFKLYLEDPANLCLSFGEEPGVICHLDGVDFERPRSSPNILSWLEWKKNQSHTM